jgi:DnaJ-class molecular chaperone
MIRDLYRTLEVSPQASEEELKRSYRRLALLYHPDRNQAARETEDRFKEAAYAYSILSNGDKRKRYDLYRQFMKHSARWGIPPSPSQERILNDIFLDPKLPGLGKWLEEILKAKEISGNGRTFWTLSRATLRLLRQVYEEEKKKADSTKKKGPLKVRRRPRIVSYPKTVLKKVGSVFIPLGGGRRGANRTGTGPSSGAAGPYGPDTGGTNQRGDIEWALPLTREEAEHGTRMTLSFFRDSHWDRLSVHVPPNTREGVRLRVRNKGNRIASSGETGDLYLRVMIR